MPNTIHNRKNVLQDYFEQPRESAVRLSRFVTSGTRVEIIADYHRRKGEQAAIEINPERGTHMRRSDGSHEVWIRYDKDGLIPQWIYLDEISIVKSMSQQ